MTLDERIESIKDELYVLAVALQYKLEGLADDLKHNKLRGVNGSGVVQSYGPEIDSLCRCLQLLLELRGEKEEDICWEFVDTSRIVSDAIRRPRVV